MRRLPATDIALAAALAVFAQAQVWSAGDDLLVQVPGALLLTVPLAWRRAAPVASAATVFVALGAGSLVTAPAEAIWTLITMLVAVYSCASYARLRPAILLAVLAAIALSLSILNDATDDAANIPPTILVFLVVPWAAGRVLHRQHASAVAEVARAREEEARDATARERDRIARELHDIVAHSLGVIAVQAEAAEAALERRPEAAAAPVAAISRTAQEALGEMRNLLGLLRTGETNGDLSPQPGLADLDALFGRVRDAGLAVDVRTTGHARALPPGLDLAAYRVVQEGLTNVLRHAGAARAEVDLSWNGAALALEVRDDGHGIPGTDPPGHGLAGVRERVAMYGGRVDAGPLPGGGFRIAAELPLPEAAA